MVFMVVVNRCCRYCCGGRGAVVVVVVVGGVGDAVVMSLRMLFCRFRCVVVVF